MKLELELEFELELELVAATGLSLLYNSHFLLKLEQL
jgi:hypothetical protein